MTLWNGSSYLEENSFCKALGRSKARFIVYWKFCLKSDFLQETRNRTDVCKAYIDVLVEKKNKPEISWQINLLYEWCMCVCVYVCLYSYKFYLFTLVFEWSNLVSTYDEVFEAMMTKCCKSDPLRFLTKGIFLVGSTRVLKGNPNDRDKWDWIHIFMYIRFRLSSKYCNAGLSCNIRILILVRYLKPSS